MAVDEGTRHRIHSHFIEQMGEADANGLMELLPPVGWADVATKRDLDALEERLTARVQGSADRLDAKFMGRLMWVVVTLSGVQAAGIGIVAGLT